MKVIDVVMKELREKKAQMIGAVSGGQARDFAEYKGMCGEIRGLIAIENYLLDLAKNLEQTDD